jgi:hypothetical protein
MMNSFFQKFVKVCPKTGRIRKITVPGGFYKFLFPFVGLAAMIWILIRVIPKPSRLSYPCVKTAMPLATGFVGYLAMLFVSAVAFIKSRKPLRYFPIFFVGSFAVFGIAGFYVTGNNIFQKEIELKTNAVVISNQPMGEAKGIFPGRVVWVHNPNAVNQNCQPNLLKHAWWMAENNNQSSIDSMVSTAIQNITGQLSDSAAWQALFRYNNESRGKGAVNYVPGEKIFIKINECSGWGGNFNPTDLSKVNGNWYGMSETTPATVLSVLHQLVDIMHIAQSDIYVGDPMRNIYKEWYAQWHPNYPDVHYIGEGDYSRLGREQVKISNTAIIHYSDRGKVLRPNVMYQLPTNDQSKVWNDKLYTIFEDAEYMINIPQIKGHMRAGITLFAKNHFGSQSRSSAGHLHMGLPCPIEMSNDTSRLGYGLYRVQVDLMTQSLLRKKNLIFLLDGLWGTDYEQDMPLKFQMPPFNNTFSSSIFASLDNVAIESVAYDFLRSEFTVERAQELEHNPFIQMRGCDDYLHQAADSANWPKGIKYDPDSTGVYIYSLGVHEHWNNPIDKKYSRNLGTGNGIELISIEPGQSTGIANHQETLPKSFVLSQNYPNPFNPTTKISYSIPASAKVVIKVYDAAGREIETIENSERSAGTYVVSFNAKQLSSGIYYYRLTANNYSATKKFVLIK